MRDILLGLNPFKPLLVGRALDLVVLLGPLDCETGGEINGFGYGPIKIHLFFIISHHFASLLIIQISERILLSFLFSHCWSILFQCWK